MPEVQNVGAVDYAQYQPSQYQYDDYAENYNMQPEIYDEDYETKKAASKSRLGATILGLAIIGGAALWGGHAWGKKSAAKELDQLKDAAKKYSNKEIVDYLRKVYNAIKQSFDNILLSLGLKGHLTGKVERTDNGRKLQPGVQVTTAE